MRKLVPKTINNNVQKAEDFFVQFSNDLAINSDNKDAIIRNAIAVTAVYDKYLYYPLIGQMFTLLGYQCQVTRDGDTNNRSDAYLIDDSDSIPIEIKSPTEIPYINNKSIRQAVENKIVLLSRKFYPTKKDTTSLAIGYSYPAERSGVIDLIEDVKNTFDINIGIISLEDMLKCLWDAIVENKPFDKSRITNLKGQLL